MKKKLSLAQFKRDAAAGMSLELIERYGEKIFPEKFKGVRKVCKVYSTGITLLTPKGGKSDLRLEYASLVDYDGDTLTVYEPGTRDPNEEEMAVLEGWHRKLAAYEKKNPYGNSYWMMKDYFENSTCPWMSGFETVRGKIYTNPKVQDNAIKGEPILKYKVIHGQ